MHPFQFSQYLLYIILIRCRSGPATTLSKQALKSMHSFVLKIRFQLSFPSFTTLPSTDPSFFVLRMIRATCSTHPLERSTVSHVFTLSICSNHLFTYFHIAHLPFLHSHLTLQPHLCLSVVYLHAYGRFLDSTDLTSRQCARLISTTFS